MGLFKKKCEYCRNKINKGKEIWKDVKVPGFNGTYNKPFCSEEHANNYTKEVKAKSCSGCCG